MNAGTPQTLRWMVHYRHATDEHEAGFFYRITEDSPLRGPFGTRHSAQVAVMWDLHPNGIPLIVRTFDA